MRTLVSPLQWVCGLRDRVPAVSPLSPHPVPSVHAHRYWEVHPEERTRSKMMVKRHIFQSFDEKPTLSVSDGRKLQIFPSPQGGLIASGTTAKPTYKQKARQKAARERLKLLGGGGSDNEADDVDVDVDVTVSACCAFFAAAFRLTVLLPPLRLSLYFLFVSARSPRCTSSTSSFGPRRTRPRRTPTRARASCSIRTSTISTWTRCAPYLRIPV